LVCLVAILMVLVAIYFFFSLAMAGHRHTRSILGDQDIQGITRSVFQYVVRGKRLYNLSSRDSRLRFMED